MRGHSSTRSHVPVGPRMCRSQKNARGAAGSRHHGRWHHACFSGQEASGETMQLLAEVPLAEGRVQAHNTPQSSPVQSLSRVQLFATPWTAAHQASLSFTISWSLLKLMSIESRLLSNHLILCHPLLLLPSVFPNLRFFQ